MATVEIKKHHIRAFKDICEQFGVSPVIRWGRSKFHGGRVYLCTLADIIRKDWKIVTQHIMSFSEEVERQSYASVYYSLYSCNILFLKSHPYPCYASWKCEHDYGHELDHKMPKYHFPELTFNPHNWQALTHEANQEKGSKVLKKDLGDYLQIHTQIFNQDVDALLF